MRTPSAAKTSDPSEDSRSTWSRSVSQVRFTWLGINEGHHDLSHRGDDDADAVDKLTRINNWYAQQLAALMTKLRAVPDGNGTTMLDNTLILWANELGNQEAVGLLEATLAEEKATDEALTELAEAVVNQEAQQEAA